MRKLRTLSSPSLIASAPLYDMYFLSSPRKMSRNLAHVPVALHAARSGTSPYLASITLSNESKAVTIPSTTGMPPLVRTGEWRPWAFVLVFAISVIGEMSCEPHASSPEAAALTTQTVSPTVTSAAFLSVEQHDWPTGK